MPNAVVKAYAKETGKSAEHIERWWKEAEEEASKKFKKSDRRYWAYVNGIVEKRGKLVHGKKNEGIEVLTFKEFLNELLDTKLDLEEVPVRKGHQQWKLKLGDDQVVHFYVVWVTPKSIDFFFKDEKGSVELTGKGNELKVFGAAKQILTDLLKNKPDLITFEADKSSGETRANLYRRFIERWKPSGYKFSEISDKHSSNFYLKRIKSEDEIATEKAAEKKNDPNILRVRTRDWMDDL
jgi:hypothetical protein